MLDESRAALTAVLTSELAKLRALSDLPELLGEAERKCLETYARIVKLLERQAAEGRVPNLARLMREGAWGPLRSREPLLSPLLWTTIATGQRPQDHGILDFVEPGPDGKAVVSATVSVARARR